MASKRKLFIGPRLRRLRRELGLTQSAMAEELSVSPSYINLIERNQRPLTADLLLSLAETYSLDIQSFAGDGGEALFDRLAEAFKDPIFQELEISRADMQELAAGNPVMAEALAALYKAYHENSLTLTDLQSLKGEDDATSPLDEAWNVIQENNNFFASLDEAAERLSREMHLLEDGPFAAFKKRFKEQHSLDVKTLPADIMMGAYRRLDRHRQQVVISEAMDSASRNFQLALQLTYLELGPRLETITDELCHGSEAGRRITRTALANYTAAALFMPYGEFKASAVELRYDVEALGRRFNASFEQVCHRLTTLQKPGQEGIPFFFLRVDAAGNVSKRYDGGGFPFARYGGSCPLWNVHVTFNSPRQILTQIIELPGGDQFFSIARTVSGGIGGYNMPKAERAVALGCAIEHAEGLVYAENMDTQQAQVTPIGITCRLCDRQDCISRAHPPLHKRLLPDDYRRTVAPFAFAFD